MLTLKIAFDEGSEDFFNKVYEMLEYAVRFEVYNQDDYRFKKKAFKLKAACGAKMVPFAGLYDDKTLVSAFYSESGECTPENITAKVLEYLIGISYSGNMLITKVTGNNSKWIQDGESFFGYCKALVEGLSCYLEGDSGIRTSNVQSIDWENGEFKTRNSTYKFKLMKNEDGNKNC